MGIDNQIICVTTAQYHGMQARLGNAYSQEMDPFNAGQLFSEIYYEIINESEVIKGSKKTCFGI